MWGSSRALTLVVGTPTRRAIRNMTTNEKLKGWVDEMKALCQPD